MAKPEIRLKGFKGEWSNISITKIATLKAGKSFNKNDAVDTPMNGYYPCYGGNGQRGYVPYYNQEGTFNIIGRQGALCGCVNIADGKFYATEHAVLVTPIVDTDFNFLHESLVRANINQYATGAAQPGISVANVNAQLFLNMPLLDEQKAVGDYFKSLDSMIQGVTKKIASLKQMKQACLVSMFPQAGETTPRVRFKGFKGEWVKDKAVNLFMTFNERNRPDLPVLSANQDIRGMAPRSETGYTISHNKANEVTYKVVKPGQYVIHLRSFQGGFAHSAIEGITSPAYTVFGFKDADKHDDYFWKIIFMSKEFIKSLETITYGIRDGRSISFSEFAEMNFFFPSKEEQQQIASFFKILDKQISLQVQKLEKLKQIKTACLDKMFV